MNSINKAVIKKPKSKQTNKKKEAMMAQALGILRHECCHKFEDGLDCIVDSRTV